MIYPLITGALMMTSMTFGLIDVSPNYVYYDQITYLTDTQILPTFVDDKFQLDSYLTPLQIAYIGMRLKALTPNYKSNIPYLSDINDKLDAFPYVQTIFEQEYIPETIPASQTLSPVNIQNTLLILSRMFPSADFTEKKDSDALLDRKKCIEILFELPTVNVQFQSYQTFQANRSVTYTGSAIKQFVLGDDSALNQLEFLKYAAKKDLYSRIFWQMATTTNRQYQEFHEDPSKETLDILTKHLNQAVLYFYEGKYWLTVDECNLILKEDPKHVEALSLKGSAYYALRDYSTAKKYWTKALYIDPNNQGLKYFMKLLK